MLTDADSGATANDNSVLSIPEFNFVNNFRVGGSGIAAKSSKIIGFARYNGWNNSNSYSYAGYYDNPCVQVSQPSSQIFTVNFDTVSGGANTTALDYILILHFKKCSCDSYK